MGSQQVETGSQSAAAAAPGGAPLKVAIVGFGTVGRSVAKVLSSGIHPSLQLTAICNRGVERKKVDWVPADVDWTDSFEAVIASDADIVVELMGGLEPAGDLIRRALRAGKSVVTANKQLISTQGVELLALARAQQRELLFEASVAGGIPIVRAVREGLAGDRLLRVAGILNGTCNYILTRMDSAGLSFARSVERSAGAWICRGGSVGGRRWIRCPREDRDSDRGWAWDARSTPLAYRADRSRRSIASISRTRESSTARSGRSHGPSGRPGPTGGCLRRCVPRSSPFVAARTRAGQPESRQRATASSAGKRHIPDSAPAVIRRRSLWSRT